jgi:NhaA family Na+:H+ antiporter
VGQSPPSAGRPTWSLIAGFVLDNSLLLLIGAAAAMIWANTAHASYGRVVDALRFAVNDIGMVFFFAAAMKEVVEAMLPGGPLGSFRRAGVPVLAALGGMAGPALLFTALAHAIDRPDILRGWAIPCATDIAFSFLAARFAFGRAHPAIPFLLLLAIADDGFGLIVLALFYPSGPVTLPAVVGWLAPAMLVAWVLRKLGVESFWLYIFGPGVLSWIGLHEGGIHPALAMVPIVPFMPHERSELWRFGATQPLRLATLQQFQAWWRLPVQVILFGFGFVNAGVPFTSVGEITWIIAVSLIVGKPIGIVLTTVVAERFGFQRDPGLDGRSLVTLGILAGIGFTVALFFATASFPPGPVLEQAKMGALYSFAAAALGVAVARALGIKSEARSEKPEVRSQK